MPLSTYEAEPRQQKSVGDRGRIMTTEDTPENFKRNSLSKNHQNEGKPEWDEVFKICV